MRTLLILVVLVMLTGCTTGGWPCVGTTRAGTLQPTYDVFRIYCDRECAPSDRTGWCAHQHASGAR